ncbi:MAG: hypothetical protein AB2A00_40295 [Myxococcota bacterium]
MARLKRVREVEMQFIRATPGGIAVLTLVQRPARFMTLGAAERAFAEQVAAETAPNTLASCSAILGTGFWVATARSVIAGVQLLARTNHPQTVVSSVAEAATWLAPHVKRADGSHPSVAELIRAIDDVVGTTSKAGAALAV